MDDRPFWFHPDAHAEVPSAHDRYVEVTLELAERFQEELERSRQMIARNLLTWPAILVRYPTLSNEELSVPHPLIVQEALSSGGDRQ
jgi:hypothetical protein